VSGPLRNTHALADDDGDGQEVGMGESICRVCGLDELDERWTEPDGAHYVICSCCGAESGVDDLDLKWVRGYRAKWITAGGAWFSPEQRPAGWRLDRQMRELPAAWR
jgi:hypothetical protein